MRRALLLASIVAATAVVAQIACSDSGTQNDGGPDVAADTNVGPAALCVPVPTAATFPSGTCNAPKPAQPDAFDEALASLGLDRCTVMENPANMPLSVMNVMDGMRGTQDMTVLGESSVSETATKPLDYVVSGAQLLSVTIK